MARRLGRAEGGGVRGALAARDTAPPASTPARFPQRGVRGTLPRAGLTAPWLPHPQALLRRRHQRRGTCAPARPLRRPVACRGGGHWRDAHLCTGTCRQRGRAFRVYKFRTMGPTPTTSPSTSRSRRSTSGCASARSTTTRASRAWAASAPDVARRAAPARQRAARPDVAHRPRPVTYDELGAFGAEAAELLSVPPGITGAWQCGPRNRATFENGMRQRVELEYVRTAGLRADARIFLRTLAVMLGRGRMGG